ncbi:MAG: hypothetical protein EPO65_06420 [Dehalococcoidia bacterium]|nr:MAG: hypothetical protein EPO65_06420 [Dehalococcoidia bacterium]
MNTAEYCANCEEPILGQPVFFDGGVYCCTGCIAGGPCVCTYQAPAADASTPAPVYPTTAPAPGPAPAYSAPIAAAPVYQTSVAAPAPRATAPVLPSSSTMGRDPIPFPSRENGPRAIVLRLGGFRDQRDLLEFALALEDVGALAEVSLTRAEPADAWFAVRAASTQQVVAALQEVRGWLISANASESYVEGRVESAPVEIAPVEVAPVAPPIPDTAAETEPVLPHRPRFRVFSPRRAETSVGPGFTITPAAQITAAPAAAIAPESAYQPATQPAAISTVPEVAPAAVATAQPAYTAPPTPVLPMPARPAPVPQPAPRFVEPTRPVLPVPAAAAPVAAPAPVEAPAAVIAPPPYVAEPAPIIAAAPAPVVEPARPVEPVSVAPVAPMARPAVTTDLAASHQPDMIAIDDRPGGAVPLVEHLTLVVYPFHSFVALNEFQSAIRVLRGVTNTRVRRFYRGTLHLAVDYEDVIPLAERLQDLRGFRWQMVSETRQEIELLLEDTGALMAAEGDG